MEVPRLGEECAVSVDVGEEEVVKKPYMRLLVDVECVSYFENLEEGVPFGTELRGHVNPQSLNADVVHAPRGKE